MNVNEIQSSLREQALDAWLFFDHHRKDPIAYRVLGLEADVLPTRRWYYLIPAEGEPQALVHRIEPHILDRLPGSKTTYASWKSQISSLHSMLTGMTRVAMQYSPKCAIPYVSNVDAGTVELVRESGTEVVSSANLVQSFESQWSEEQIESHYRARDVLDRARKAAFELIRIRVRDGVPTNEFEIQQFLLEQFGRNDLTTDHGPIVAVNENASNPHYEPSTTRHRQIAAGDLVLIDMWAKGRTARAVYYDITWTAYCGGHPPDEILRVFDIVRSARDHGVTTIQQAVSSGTPVRGFEVDDAVRGVIARAGYGDYFFHRTGHSIGEDVHGTGANMDNLETHDERTILPNTCFSIEPGIYLPGFGIRSEVNVLVRNDGATVTGESQHELLRLV
jgi:Xaa-Pro aminopeptidase